MTTEATKTPAQELEFEPYGCYLLVQIDKASNVTSGGIILAGAPNVPCVATVLAVGTGQKNGLNGELIPCISNVGDRVLINKHGATTLKIAGGVEVTMLNENDVYGRFSLGIAADEVKIATGGLENVPAVH